MSCSMSSVRGRTFSVLTVFYVSGKVCDQCYPSDTDNKDSLQTRTATEEKPVNSAFAYGLCHKMYGVLQGSLLGEEGYVGKVKDLGVPCYVNVEVLLQEINPRGGGGLNVQNPKTKLKSER